jgi:hypothetical protein
MIHIFHSVAHWLLKAATCQDYCFLWTREFSDIDGPFLAANKLITNLFRVKGNLIFNPERIRSDVVLAPILVKLIKTESGYKPDVWNLSEDEKKVFISKVLKEFGTRLFRLSSTATPKTTIGHGSFRPFVELVNQIIGVHPYSVKNAINCCKEIEMWFETHNFWPEIVWNQNNEYITTFVNERCLELWCSNQLHVEDFETKIKITGADWLHPAIQNVKAENELFRVKPLIIVMTYDWNMGLRCKIVLNGVCLFKPLYRELNTLSSAETDLKVYKKSQALIAEKFPTAFQNFLIQLGKLHNRGVYLSAKTILERVYASKSNTNSGEFELSLFLYGQSITVRVMKADSYPYLFVQKDEIPKSISSFMELSQQFQDDPKKHNMWEATALLIYVYKTILFQSKTRNKLSAICQEFLTSNIPRLYLTGWKGGIEFYLLIALMTTRSLKHRLGADELVQHKIFQEWLKSDDLNLRLQEAIDDFDYLTNSEMVSFS